MASEEDPKIRRIAIVLHSMDAGTVRKLLDQFPESTARAIRRGLMHLGEVTPAERAAAAQELNRIMGKPSSPQTKDNPAAQLLDQGRGIHDAIQWSTEARERALNAQGAEMPSEAPASSRTWLDVPPATLASILENERPILVAAILHELPVLMATSVLQLLPISIAAESMAAMPQLHRNDPNVLAELLAQVRSKADEAVRNNQRNVEGITKLKAIVAHVPEDQRYLWSTALSHFDPQLPSVLGYGNGDAPPWTPATSTPSNLSSDKQSPTVIPFPEGSANRARSSQHGSLPSMADAPTIDPLSESSTDEHRVRTPYRSLLDLMDLDDLDFVEVLHSVEPAMVLLALIGVEPRWMKRVERLMPRKDLPRLRNRLHEMSDVTLHDIDAACAAILENANLLHSEGRIGDRSPRSLPVAA